MAELKELQAKLTSTLEGVRELIDLSVEYR